MPIEIIYTIEDRRGRTATTSVKLASVESKVRTGLFAVAWADVIDNIIGGVIRSAFAVLNVPLTGILLNTSDVGSDVEEIAAATFRANAGTLVQVNIPAILETLVVNETGELNTVQADVAAFRAMMEDGIAVTGGTIIPCDIGESGGLEMQFIRERSRNSGTRKVNN